MKSGRSFDLPLSEHMVGIVERAMALGDMLFPEAPWLFPTRAHKDNAKRGIVKGQVIATQVWREKTLPSDTGHLLRHTYRTIAQRITLDKIEARMLLDHTVPGHRRRLHPREGAVRPAARRAGAHERGDHSALARTAPHGGTRRSCTTAPAGRANFRPRRHHRLTISPPTT